MRVLPPGSNLKPYTIYRVLKSIDNVAASKIMSLFGEIGLGTQYELPKSVKSYRIWASGRGENRKMLKIALPLTLAIMCFPPRCGKL